MVGEFVQYKIILSSQLFFIGKFEHLEDTFKDNRIYVKFMKFSLQINNLKVTNKHSSSKVNRMFIQNDLDFNKVLSIYLDVFLNVTSCFRTSREDSKYSCYNSKIPEPRT